MANHTLTSLFSDIANSIREKTGVSGPIVADNFAYEISTNIIDINAGTSDANATAADILSPKTAYVSGNKIIGTLPTVAHPNPTINKATFNTTSGNVEIAANHIQSNGYSTGGTTTATTNVQIGIGSVSSTFNTTSGNVEISKGAGYIAAGSTNQVVGISTQTVTPGTASGPTVTGYVNGTAGYTSGYNKTITATVAQASLVPSNISGAAYLENTGDYGFQVNVVVPAGYHTAGTVTKNFTTGIFPAPESKATADKMLTGYSLYDEDGRLVTGTMVNQGAQTNTITTQGGTYTIPAGYHNGSGVVTASVTTATHPNPSINKATFNATSGNVEVAANHVQATGYVTGGTTSASTNVVVGLGSVSGSFNATSGNVEITKNAGYIAAGSSNVQLGTATINAPSGSKTQSTPSFSWDATNRKLTASVAATTQPIYANVTNSGYIAAGEKSGTFTMGASSNTYTMAAATINAPSATKAQSTPTFTWDAVNSKLTASVAATSVTVYANTNSAGYAPAETRSGTVTMSASSNSYTIEGASINAPSGSQTQSTPGLAFNASNGVVTATVAAINGTAYANVVGAGYISAGTQSGNFVMGASSNTINVGVTSRSAKDGGVSTVSSGIVTNISNGAVDATDNITFLAGANGRYKLTSVGNGNVSTGAGYVASGTTKSNDASAAYYVNKSTITYDSANSSVSASGATVTYNLKVATTEGYNKAMTQWVNGTKAIGSGSATTPATTIYTGPVGMTFNASNGVVTASSVSKGTSITPTVVAGYVSAGTAGTITATSNANTYSVGLATLGKTAASSSATSDGLVTNISNGAVNASDKILLATGANSKYRITTTGSGGAKITAAGYIAKDVSNSNSTTAAYYVNKATASSTQPTASATGGTASASTTFTNILTTTTATDYKIEAAASATGGSSSTTAGSVTVSEGYAPSAITASVAAKSASGATASNTATKYLNKQTITAYAGTSKAQSTPSFAFNASNGVVTASVAATSQTIYRNVSEGYRNSADTTAGTFSMTASSNTYNVGLASINAPSGSKAQSTPTFSINTTTGVVTASVAATSGTAYANVATAGYTAAGAKSGTFSMTASSNTYTIAAATANTQTGAATIGASSALANAITPTNVLLTDTATVYKLVSSANATSGAITAKTVEATAGPGYVASGTVKASATVSAVAAKTASDSKTKYLNAQTISSTSITPYTNGTAQTVTVSEGYRNAAATITVAGVAAATRSAGTAAVLNNSNGNVRYYVNTTAGYTAANTSAYYLQLNTKAGGTTTVTTTESTLINAGQFAIGAIKAKAAAGTLAAGTAAVLNNSNGNVRYYRNVSAAGYIAANTTAYYLQLNTKAGGTTYVDGTGATLVNAGQFVTSAVVAKAANVTYNSTTQTLTIPAGLVTVS